jgi:membrane protein implicated in regulation of membrane protease activity
VVLAANAAFLVVFALFVIAMLVLVVLTVRFVVRRDREKRAAWRSQHPPPD